MLLVFTLSSCNVGEKQKTLNFLNYGANIDNKSLKLFEEKYGIKVNQETFDDMEQMYTKVSSGGIKYDVVLVSDNLMQRMIKEKLLAKLDKDNIPNIKQMDSVYMNLEMDPGNVYSVPFMFGTVGIIYNTDYVKEKVDSWDILWDKKYKGEIFMFDTYRDTMGAALKRLGYSMNTTNPDEINAAKKSLIEQKPLVKTMKYLAEQEIISRDSQGKMTIRKSIGNRVFRLVEIHLDKLVDDEPEKKEQPKKADNEQQSSIFTGSTKVIEDDLPF